MVDGCEYMYAKALLGFHISKIYYDFHCGKFHTNKMIIISSESPAELLVLPKLFRLISIFCTSNLSFKLSTKFQAKILYILNKMNFSKKFGTYDGHRAVCICTSSITEEKKNVFVASGVGFRFFNFSPSNHQFD